MMSSWSNILILAHAFVYAWQEMNFAKFHGKVTNFIYFCLVFWFLLDFIPCLIFLLRVKVIFIFIIVEHNVSVSSIRSFMYILCIQSIFSSTVTSSVNN